MIQERTHTPIDGSFPQFIRPQIPFQFIQPVSPQYVEGL